MNTGKAIIFESFCSIPGQDFLHSCRHRLGLHLSSLTMAIRVKFSATSASFRFGFGGISVSVDQSDESMKGRESWNRLGLIKRGAMESYLKKE